MNEETVFITSELEETEAEYFTSQATEEENQEVFQIESEPEITEIEIYSELTSEPVIAELSETVAETETESTVAATTIDYDAEIYKNTKTSAECLSLLSGLALIIITIVICVAITKVLIDF